MAEKYNKLGQIESLKKLCFLANTLAKEEKLIEMGITTYVYKDTIEDYIDTVKDKAVKIVELSRYMREIPDELIEVIEKAKDIFDGLYVVFTDYTGKEERKVAKERRDKDPILFGMFKNDVNVADRFYFLGDWVDEYCDLTLDKMISEYKEKKGYSPAIETSIPTTSDELIAILNSYNKSNDKNKTAAVTVNNGTISIPFHTATNNMPEKKEHFIDKVRSVFKK